MKLRKSTTVFLNLVLVLLVIFLVKLLSGVPKDMDIKREKRYIITGAVDEEINKIIADIGVDNFEKLVKEFAQAVNKKDINKEEVILNYYGKRGWKLHSRYREGRYIFER
ncbi:hypothetical protein NLC29_00410 [Candidatus Aminicenantes bacterium AH-873-B07]|nr:hypothetical protein [Candidatus Aminicenantes bacterium AH-873-B07]